MRVRYDTLGVSPFIIFYGYDPAIFQDVEGDVFKKEAPAVRERVEEILIIKEQLDKRLKQAREIQKKYYDKNYKFMQYQPGDLVILLSRNITTKRFSKKLDTKFLGPFKVIETKGK